MTSAGRPTRPSWWSRPSAPWLTLLASSLLAIATTGCCEPGPSPPPPEPDRPLLPPGRPQDLTEELLRRRARWRDLCASCLTGLDPQLGWCPLHRNAGALVLLPREDLELLEADRAERGAYIGALEQAGRWRVR